MLIARWLYVYLVLYIYPMTDTKFYTNKKYDYNEMSQKYNRDITNEYCDIINL